VTYQNIYQDLYPADVVPSSPVVTRVGPLNYRADGFVDTTGQVAITNAYFAKLAAGTPGTPAPSSSVVNFYKVLPGPVISLPSPSGHTQPLFTSRLPRRTSARAYFRGTTVHTTNLYNGKVQPAVFSRIPRRRPARGVYRGAYYNKTANTDTPEL
jgi:hypothetical protein